MGAPLKTSPRDGNVKVVVRVRPLSAWEGSESSALNVRGPHDLVLQPADNKGTANDGRAYSFDHVIGGETTQEMVFRRVGQPVVDNCLQGYNSTILAYGQTGSGKTHTMLGDVSSLKAGASPASPDSSVDDGPSLAGSPRQAQPILLPPECGVIPRAFAYLFDQLAEASATTSFCIKISFIEIYNEVVTDLLGGQSGLQIRHDLRTSTTFAVGAVQEQVFCLADVLSLVAQGAERRQVAHTDMNATSSRSHSILSCVVESRTEEDGITHMRRATLNLVDLAGSERQARTGAKGTRLKEASAINKSLSALGLVIMSLVTGSTHVPYRDSKLTNMLQDSLGGNAKAVLIAAVSPALSSFQETESTLGFASRAKRMKNNATVNQDSLGDATVLQQENARLRTELEAFRTLEASRLSAASASQAELEQLRVEVARLRQETGASSSDDVYAVADAQFQAWQSEEAASSLQQQLAEVLEANSTLEAQVQKLQQSNAELRRTRETMSQENTNLRVTAELVEEFNAAFQRATEEADAAKARVRELEAERDANVMELQHGKHIYKEEKSDKELLLQEFSELTKLLGAAIQEREEAIADRNAAIAQKLEMSCRYNSTQCQLESLIMAKVKVQEELENLAADAVTPDKASGLVRSSSLLNSGDRGPSPDRSRSGSTSDSSPLRPHTPDSPDAYSRQGAQPSLVRTFSNNAASHSAVGKHKDPLLRVIINKLDSMERTRSQPGTPRAAGSTTLAGQTDMYDLLRERDEALAAVAELKRQNNAVEQELLTFRAVSA